MVRVLAQKLGVLFGTSSGRPCSAAGQKIMCEVVHYNLTWRSSHLEPASSLKVFHYIKRERERQISNSLLYSHITAPKRRDQL
jgi:hypothetical protein